MMMVYSLEMSDGHHMFTIFFRIEISLRSFKVGEAVGVLNGMITF